jgi:hypothetical protein
MKSRSTDRRIQLHRRLPKQAFLKPKRREPRGVIISFRLRPSEVAALEKDMARHVTPEVNSLKQHCRKLVIDHLQHWTVYADPLRRVIGSNSRFKELDCHMTDVVFMKALAHYLDNGSVEAFGQLRAFLLGLGWPERQAQVFHNTLKDQVRLKLARHVLAKMIKSAE